MGAVRYLYLRTLKNRIKTALHKPVTLVYVAVLLLYVVMVPTSFRTIAEEYSVNNPGGMAGMLTLFAFWAIPGNLIAYAKRKGLVFRNSDIHFLFPAPVSPKLVLMYAHLKTIFMQLLLNFFIALCGATMFQVEGWRLAIYFIFAMVVENTMEGSLMLLLYGTERLGEKQRGLVIKAAYGLVGAMAVIAFWIYLKEGLSLESIAHFLNGDLIQLVPLIGWYIAVVHLLFMGATTVNVIGTLLYLVTVLAVIAAAVRMKCTGAFYEDAIRFAEDYEEVLESRRQGNTDVRLGRKKKFNRASVVWKGQGAKALFSRQLLEYRKSRYFIFDMNTVVSVLVGLGIAYMVSRGGALFESEQVVPYMLPIVSAYLIFIFTTLSNKWTKELQSPYTYLLPDSPWRKLWYATAMQHVQSIVNACLLILPPAFVMKLSPVETLLCLVFYVTLSANKLYALAVAEAALGSSMGRVGKQLFQLFIQGFVIGLAVVGAIVGAVVSGPALAYVLMDVFVLAGTLVFMVVATLNFYRMESI